MPIRCKLSTGEFIPVKDERLPVSDKTLSIPKLGPIKTSHGNGVIYLHYETILQLLGLSHKQFLEAALPFTSSPLLTFASFVTGEDCEPYVTLHLATSVDSKLHNLLSSRR